MTYRKCRVDDDGKCTTHGGWFVPQLGACQTTEILLEIREERANQFARYGDNADLEDGTGPLKAWLPGLPWAATETEEVFRADYQDYELANGKPTWMHLVREEIAEAFKEDDPQRLYEELVQVAALCVSWLEKLDARELEADNGV